MKYESYTSCSRGQMVPPDITMQVKILQTNYWTHEKCIYDIKYISVPLVSSQNIGAEGLSVYTTRHVMPGSCSLYYILRIKYGMPHII